MSTTATLDSGAPKKARRNDGGPAFPLWTQDMNLGHDAGPGMSLRDWFAGQALAGLLSDCEWNPQRREERDFTAEHAYALADAMLRARDQ